MSGPISKKHSHVVAIGAKESPRRELVIATGQRISREASITQAGDSKVFNFGTIFLEATDNTQLAKFDNFTFTVFLAPDLNGAIHTFTSLGTEVTSLGWFTNHSGTNGYEGGFWWNFQLQTNLGGVVYSWNADPIDVSCNDSAHPYFSKSNPLDPNVFDLAYYVLPSDVGASGWKTIEFPQVLKHLRRGERAGECFVEMFGIPPHYVVGSSFGAIGSHSVVLQLRR